MEKYGGKLKLKIGSGAACSDFFYRKAKVLTFIFFQNIIEM